METRQIHVRDLSTVTGIQQFEHEVQSIYFLGLEDFVGTIYLSMESDEYSNEAVPLTSNTFIIGQPMTIYNTTYTCQIYGVLDDGEKIQLSKRFRLIVDKSNDIQGESSEYPIDPNFENSIIEFVNEQKSGIAMYTDDKIDAIQATGEAVKASIPSDYTALSDEVEDVKSGLIDLGNGVIEVEKEVNWQSGWINTNGLIASSTASQFALVPMNAGETIIIGTRNSNITIIGSTTAESLEAGDTVTVIQKTTSSNVFNTYQYTATENINIVICVRTSEYTLKFVKNAPFMETLESITNPKIVFNLPKKLYALYGYEINVYFENLVEKWENFSWDVQGAIGQQFKRSLRMTPQTDAQGTYPMRFSAIGEYSTISQYANVVVSPSSAQSGKTVSVIILGDSTTDNGTVIAKLHENLDNDVMNIETLGTRGTAPNNHEGRSGWTFNGYFTSAGSGSIVNPFYNPTTQTFDANYYFTNTGIEKPDWFFINLGINDMFPYTSDSALETGITECLSKCDAMIASINSASPNTKVGVCLTIPPNDSQDAFGKAYNNNQYRDRYKRNNLLWVNALIKHYDERESEGIYIVPIYASLDTVYNMGMEELPVNARNTDITYQSPIGNGGVHPVTSGYWQIADVYTAFLKAHAE